MHNFIFSRDRFTMASRHAVFWISCYMLLLMPLLIKGGSWGDLTSSLIFFFPLILSSVIFTYVVCYRFIPELLTNGKIGLFAGKLLLLSIAGCFLLNYYVLFPNFIMGNSDKPVFSIVLSISRMFFTEGPPIMCGLFLAAKMLKRYYHEEEEKIMLAQETAVAELQLLNAQAHPHFLFNTLNNIYSFTLARSPQAGVLVQRLLALLEYMTRDCEQAQVPLEKELKMIRDYIGLEKVRYAHRLKVHIEIEGDCRDKSIAPLLLIPFIENSFKHGSSRMLKNSWIRLEMHIEEATLIFKLTNSIPRNSAIKNGDNGIGLSNVRKRLALLYPRQHEIHIKRSETVHSVVLALPLHHLNKSAYDAGDMRRHDLQQGSLLD